MRKLKKILLVALSFLFISTAMLYFLQEKLIFLPTKLPDDHNYSFTEPFEEFFLESADGAKLNALHFQVDDPKGMMVYFHGNAGDLSRWGEIVSEYTQYGYDVVVMDYRGYGKSKGRRSEQALFDDAQLFYDWALKKIPENKIVIYGRSLGASIATELASRNNPNKLILETPFYNLMDVAQERFGFLPLRTILSYKMNSNQYIQKVSCPIYIFHGTQDQVVPFESGKRLYESIPHNNKSFYTIQNGGHNNLGDFEIYWKEVAAILK